MQVVIISWKVDEKLRKCISLKNILIPRKNIKTGFEPMRPIACDFFTQLDKYGALTDCATEPTRYQLS
jgi:hypothetical protein